MSPDNLLGRKEAAKYLGVSAFTVYRWTKRNLLPHTRTPGGVFRYRVSDLDAIKAGTGPTGQRQHGGKVIYPT